MLIPPPTPNDIGRKVKVIGGHIVHGSGYILVAYVLDAVKDVSNSFRAEVSLNGGSTVITRLNDLEWDD